MSGIYIPNMRKPTRCGECPFVRTEDFNWCSRCNYNICDGLVDLNEVPEWCDLFPVPDHGPLLDAWKLPELYLPEDYPPVIPADRG